MPVEDRLVLLCCRKCMTYMPLYHPEAAAWMNNHNEGCSVWQPVLKEDRVRLGMVLDNLGTPAGAAWEGEIVVLGRQTREDYLFRAEHAPEGYTCAVGPLEELTYAVSLDAG